MRRRSILFLPAALALFLTAACGGSSGADTDGVASAGDGSRATSATDANGKTDPQQAGLDFARCMREHGIDMPDPHADGRGMVMIGPGPDAGGSGSLSGPPEGFEDADEACRHHLDGLIPEGAGPLDPEAQDRALKFAQCMREHGVNMPDPDFSGGRVEIRAGGDGTRLDPATMDAAHKACGGAFGPGGAAGGPAIAIGGRS